MRDIKRNRRQNLWRIAGATLLVLGLGAAEARSDFYIAPSIGVGVTSHQFDTRSFAGPGRVQDSRRSASGSIGLAIGTRTHLAGREVDLELEARISAAERLHAGGRRYDVSRQQIGFAAYTTLSNHSGLRTQLGLGGGARRVDITLREGANFRRDIDRAPFGMIAVRGVWTTSDTSRGFAEVRYSVHPTPRRTNTGAGIEHEMDKLTLHFGVQMDLGAR